MAKSMCKPQTIVDGLEAIDNNADKVDFIANILDTCGVPITKKVPKKKVAGTPKKSGWLCYLKYCKETGMPYSECMRDEPRKEELYISRKEYWKDLAEKDCPLK